MQFTCSENRLELADDRKSAAEELLLTEASFIHNADFELLTIADVEPDPEEPLFVTQRSAETDGVIDVMASKALLTHAGEPTLLPPDELSPLLGKLVPNDTSPRSSDSTLHRKSRSSAC